MLNTAAVVSEAEIIPLGLRSIWEAHQILIWGWKQTNNLHHLLHKCIYLCIQEVLSCILMLASVQVSVFL